ncbi:MAG: Dolichyl-phosphate-mannose-protein mannosyltransferase family protein [uncultured bacterium]|nr:MAG: Dolichyl-phosphate-mannose-protein mannosyltransferase family protein [uncultured bacterium]
MTYFMIKTAIKDLVFLSLLLGGIFFVLLGKPLFVPDEGRYAEIAREMLVSKDYLIPHLNGVVYFEKPPLFYWLTAFSFKTLGVHISAARLVNACLGLIGCLLTYLASAALYNRKIGLIAACILGTNLLYFTMSHMVSLDLPVTIFIAASLYLFLLGFYTPVSKERRLYFYAATSSAALAVLTKGLIGILFPLLIISVWLTVTQQWRQIKYCYLPTCIVLFLALAMPWHLLVEAQYPDFFSFYFLKQHLLRYTHHNIGHDEPPWFFIPYFFIGFLPWILFFPRLFYLTLHPKTLFFIIWVVCILLFFSFSHSKLIPYILPLFPALAVLTALTLADVKIKTIVLLTAGTGIVLIGLLSLFYLKDTRTILPLATFLKAHLAKETQVITYNQYYQDLPFYLERPVTILNWKNELSFGMQHQKKQAVIINDAQFLTAWHHPTQPIYVIMSQTELSQFRKSNPKEKIIVLKQTKTNTLITNNEESITCQL